MDYLEKYGASLQEETPPDDLARPNGHHRPGTVFTRLRVQKTSAVFANMTPAQLRPLVNSAMEVAVPYYASNVARSGMPVAEADIESAALEVVVYTLYVYNLWKNDHLLCKWKRLRVKRSDLSHPQSRDQVLSYCQSRFGADYPRYAAAILGMSAEEFLRWEKERREFWDRR